MNKKITFIICTNNEILLDECIFYLNRLEVPTGWDVDLFTVTDATSMTSGYNQAMKETEADIKVYMHQDVFVINKHFLSDIISIFECDVNIGMIGMVGYERLAETGCMWNEPRYGCMCAYGIGDMYKEIGDEEKVYKPEDGVTDAIVCDGLMLITSKDIPWDEETFDGWDFYDASQSLKFRLEGYRVVVPNQRFPWFIHDDGMYLNMDNYNKYHTRFTEKYGKYLGKRWDEI